MILLSLCLVSFNMFIGRRCFYLICSQCIHRLRCTAVMTMLISLLFISILTFQLFNLSSFDEMAFDSMEQHRHIYTIPVCQARTRFVYIKMIKCASTTVSGMFRRFGLQRGLSFVLPPKGRIYVGWPYQVDDTLYRPSKSTSGFDIFCDHTVYNRTKFSELMGRDTVYITSLREPFSQVKSMLNYYNVLNISRVPLSVSDRFTRFMVNIEKYEAMYKSPEASLTRYCVPDGFSMTRNLMSFNLGFPTGGFRSAAEDLAHDDNLVRQWLAALDSEFSLVIITEHFYESMVLFRRQMCWNLTDILLLEAGNAGSYEYKKKESPKLVKLYRRWSSVDYQLYHHFNDSLWKKIAEQDSSFWEEVRHYRYVNKKVNRLCVEESNKTSVIVESVWNAEFYVTPEFCELLTGNLLEPLQAWYDLQLPTHMNENEPSRITC